MQLSSPRGLESCNPGRQNPNHYHQNPRVLEFLTISCVSLCFPMVCVGFRRPGLLLSSPRGPDSGDPVATLKSPGTLELPPYRASKLIPSKLHPLRPPLSKLLLPGLLLQSCLLRCCLLRCFFLRNCLLRNVFDRICHRRGFLLRGCFLRGFCLRGCLLATCPGRSRSRSLWVDPGPAEGRSEGGHPIQKTKPVSRIDQPFMKIEAGWPNIYTI